MRQFVIIALAAALGTGLYAVGAQAADTAQQSTMKTCAASWSAMSAGDKAKSKYKDHMSSCMKGVPAGKMESAAPAPAPAMAMAMKSTKPEKAPKAMKAAVSETGSAKCKDGKVVAYKHRSGTCSGHGGVATWM